VALGGFALLCFIAVVWYVTREWMIVNRDSEKSTKTPQPVPSVKHQRLNDNVTVSPHDTTTREAETVSQDRAVALVQHSNFEINL
jgi:hypothetical protein